MQVSQLQLHDEASIGQQDSATMLETEAQKICDAPHWQANRMLELQRNYHAALQRIKDVVTP